MVRHRKAIPVSIRALSLSFSLPSFLSISLCSSPTPPAIQDLISIVAPEILESGRVTSYVCKFVAPALVRLSFAFLFSVTMLYHARVQKRDK